MVMYKVTVFFKGSPAKSITYDNVLKIYDYGLTTALFLTDHYVIYDWNINEVSCIFAEVIK